MIRIPAHSLPCLVQVYTDTFRDVNIHNRCGRSHEEQGCVLFA